VITVLNPGQSKIGALRDLVVALLKEHEADGTIPTNARFLFYELVQRGKINKHPTGKRRADQDLSDALTDVREAGLIPWDWLVDETRSLDDYTGFASVRDGILAKLPYTDLDCWRIMEEDSDLSKTINVARYGFVSFDIPLPVVRPVTPSTSRPSRSSGGRDRRIIAASATKPNRAAVAEDSMTARRCRPARLASTIFAVDCVRRSDPTDKIFCAICGLAPGRDASSSISTGFLPNDRGQDCPNPGRCRLR
jgi:hypothetical protein